MQTLINKFQSDTVQAKSDRPSSKFSLFRKKPQSYPTANKISLYSNIKFKLNPLRYKINRLFWGLVNETYVNPNPSTRKFTPYTIFISIPENIRQAVTLITLCGSVLLLVTRLFVTGV